MKNKSVNRSLFKVISIFLPLFLIFIFATTSSFAFHNQDKPPKVAILVIRVGNVKAFAPMTRITLKTDYSIRIQQNTTKQFISGKQYFYIDTEERLSEIVPDYPKYSGNTASYNIEYFKNISPEIFTCVKSGFEQKGYTVLNLKETAKNWSKPFSEMKVNEIIQSLEQEVDYLFIFQYMDVGKSIIESKLYDVNSENSGFTSLVFSYSLFNVKKKKRKFAYSPLTGFSVLRSTVYNTKVMTDKNLRKKISVNCKGDNNITEITHNFNDNELIEILSDVILNGFQCPPEKFIDCYKECNDIFRIKGLLSKIP